MNQSSSCYRRSSNSWLEYRFSCVFFNFGLIIILMGACADTHGGVCGCSSAIVFSHPISLRNQFYQYRNFPYGSVFNFMRSKSELWITFLNQIKKKVYLNIPFFRFIYFCKIILTYFIKITQIDFHRQKWPKFWPNSNC